MKFITKLIIVFFVVILLGVSFNYFIIQRKAEKSRVTDKMTLPAKKFKILHIMSYHSTWEWTDNQFNGFKEALTDLNIEYKVFQMAFLSRPGLG